MARKGITKNDVFNAANAIKARGFEPTLTTIRAELKEGSFSTISQHLADWKTKEAEFVEVASMPMEAENAVLQASATIWNICKMEADKDLKAAKQRFSDEEKELNSIIEMLKEDVANFEEENRRLKDGYEKLDLMQKQTESELSKASTELETIKVINKTLITELKIGTKQPVNAGKKQVQKRAKVAEPENKQV